ncbi:MAG: glutathione ABC transporter substrate-binding protein [Firmicutes bacterium]|nr:glutathione ABC transporter substrate-binding protein [Bacillota bacterium]
MAEKVLVYGAAAGPVGLSPSLTNDSASSNANSQMYETLFRRNYETNEIEPLLALSYENPDDTTYVIKLREGVKFHDGTDFNAAAVKFTIERMMDPAVASPRASLWESVESVEVADEHTVVIKLKRPDGLFLANLTHDNSAIVSPTAVAKYGNLMQNPVGTGPFKFESMVTNDSLTMVRNDDYWGTPAKLDKIVFRVIPEAATRIAMLETGEVDFIDNIPPEQLPRLQFNPDIRVQTSTGTPIRYLSFNFDKEPWKNKLVRQAVAYALDIDALVSTFDGLAVRSDSIIGPQVFGYKPEAEEHGYEYNPEKSKALLAQAGFPNGFRTTLWASNSSEDYVRAAQIIQAQLRQVGIQADLKILDWGAYLDATLTGETDMFLLGWSNLTQDGSGMLYPNLHSANAGASNRSFYRNPEADKLIEASQLSIDQDERLELLHQANLFLMEDVAMVPLWHQVNTIAMRERVTGLIQGPTADWELYPVDVR